MQPNVFKQRLQAGEAAVGFLLAYDAPWLIEVLGGAGYDFVVIDLEHEPFDAQTVAGLIRTADGVGVSSIVRMEATDRLAPFLSAGVHGVQVPDIRGREHAERIVELTRFAPIGRRTYYSQTRAADYGIGIDESVWPQEANERLLVIGMLEDIAVLDELDEILGIDGIDAFHIGPLDLAQSMGYPSPDELDAVIAEAVRRCRAAGKWVAVGALTPWGIDSVEKYVGAGVQIFNVASAWLLTEAVTSFLAQVEARLPTELRKPVARLVAPNKYISRRR